MTPRWPRLLRGGWGLLLLVAPGPVLRLCGGERSPSVTVAARVLGARHVAESVVMGAERDAHPPRWITAIDCVHAASMLVLAAVSPRLRRDALASAAAAGTLVALSVYERPAALTGKPRSAPLPRA